MKENKKNIVFIGVIGILVLVVIILGISLVNEKNKNTNPSDSQPTQKNEQSATVSEQTTAGDAGDMTEDVETTTVGEPQTTLAPEDLAAADASMADMIETLISKELTCHTSGDVLYAVADSDREMYSYVTVNDILKNANIDHGKNTFEQNVKSVLTGHTTETDGTAMIWPKQDGQVFWVLITGTFETGYQVHVQTAAADPFAAERVTYDDILVSVYYERKDMMYDSDTCSLGFWDEADKVIKYYFFDEEGRIDIPVSGSMQIAGFFIKDVQGSRTASADGNSGIIKYVEDTPVKISGKKGNVLNIHIEEGVYADDDITVSQEWFLNR